MPVPESVTVCVLPVTRLELSVITRFLVAAPPTVGKKRTRMMQLAPDANVVPHPPEATARAVLENPPPAGVIAMLAMVNVAPPVLLRVTSTVELLLTWTLPKSTAVVLTPATGTTPSPDKFTVWVLPGMLLELSVTVKVALRTPIVDGLNRTVIVQLAPAAKVVPQVPPARENPAPVVKVTLAIANEPVPVFDNVTVWVGELVFSVCLPNANDPGDTPATGVGTTPSPDNVTVWMLPGALLESSVTVTRPPRTPKVVGLKRTRIVQVAPAANVVVHVPPNRLNPAPVTTTLAIANVASPVFDNVTVCVGELVLMFCLPNANDPGDTPAIGAVPVPVTATFNGRPLLVTAIVAPTAPRAVGANRTLTIHVAPDANTVVAVQVVPVVTIWNDGSLPIASPTELKLNGRSPTLLTVTACVEVVPTLTPPNANGDGVAAAVGATEKSWKALHSLVTASLAMQNRRFSMFHNVSLAPSPFGNGGPAATEALSATVMLPLALSVIVYCDAGSNGGASERSPRGTPPCHSSTSRRS